MERRLRPSTAALDMIQPLKVRQGSDQYESVPAASTRCAASPNRPRSEIPQNHQGQSIVRSGAARQRRSAERGQGSGRIIAADIRTSAQ